MDDLVPSIQERRTTSSSLSNSNVTNVFFTYGSTLNSTEEPPPRPGIPLPSAAWAGLGLLGLFGAIRWNRSLA